MISSAAPTKPKVDREAFPIPGPYKEKNTLHNLIRYTQLFIKLTSIRTKKPNILHEIQPFLNSVFKGHSNVLTCKSPILCNCIS